MTKVKLKNIMGADFCVRPMMIALLAIGMVMFSGCEKDPKDDSNNSGTEEPAEIEESGLYNPNDDVLSVAVRNVHIKYSYQNPLATDKSVVYAEAMTCKGRAYVKGTHMDAVHFDRDGYDNHEFIIYSTSPLYKAYSFDDHEWFSMNYYDYYMCPNITQGGGMFSIGTQQVRAIEKYFRIDKKANFWDTPYIYQTSNGNYKMTRWRENESKKTIAGIQCDGYSVHEKHEYAASTNNQEFILHKGWYDPQTNVVMRYEEYTTTNENLLQYWFEINEIEYGKVTVSEMDAILNNYLKTNNPKDISTEEEPGTNW
jgi:hypothetical protein